MRWTSTIACAALLVATLPATGSDTAAEGRGRVAAYQVTFENLTTGQPLSPPVAATHRGAALMFAEGRFASPELEAIAEDGNQVPMFDLFATADRTTDVVDLGMPLVPAEVGAGGGLSHSVTFMLDASPGDRMSMATMLICTNDGFTGLDRARLPSVGSRLYLLYAYDAGTENNTQASEDIVDPCSALGPFELADDPNGNEDEAVETIPQHPIMRHLNIGRYGDLDPADHGWMAPVARVTATHVDPTAARFSAPLSGLAEVPMVQSEASGKAQFRLEGEGTRLEYKLQASHLTGVTAAHIHTGLPDENGGVVAFLFGPSEPVDVDGILAKGEISGGDLIGAFEGDLAGFLEALRHGELYVNVHTTANPGGELRGQIGAE